MSISVGQLHSVMQLLEVISKNKFKPNELIADMGKVLVCPIDDVLNLSSRCGWIEIDDQGFLKLSTRGIFLINIPHYEFRLREQIRDYIEVSQPAWSKLIMSGRHELSKYVEPDIRQCFDEADLFENPNSEGVVKWWDDLACLVRGLRNSAMTDIGREGEKLSIKYERRRTNNEPLWQAIETNRAGYDVLSVFSMLDTTPLQIEVKCSKEKRKTAFFYVTEHEWETACAARQFKFHVWHLATPPQVAILDISDVEPHLPTNRLSGKWQSTKIPFNSFSVKFQNFL